MPDKDSDHCKCPYPCGRHGDCRACAEHHRKAGSRTNCGKDGKEAEGEEGRP